jgi:hypothetical protein
VCCRMWRPCIHGTELAFVLGGAVLHIPGRIGQIKLLGTHTPGTRGIKHQAVGIEMPIQNKLSTGRSALWI